MSVIVHPTPETTPTLINYPPPTWLKHTPVFMLPYEAFDGHNVPFGTDAKYLSVGLAQWRYESEHDQSALSVKSWRKPNDRWSRESEEVPIHRHVDMTILLSYFVSHAENEGDINVPAGTFENQATPLVLRTLGEIPSESREHIQRCRERLHVLRDLLNRLYPTD